MKQFCMMALVGLLVVGCQEVPKGYVINGEVENMPDGKIYLKSFRNKMFFDVDTAEVKDGKFTFKGAVDQPLLFGLATESMNYPVQLFLENTDMNVKIGNDGETIAGSATNLYDCMRKAVSFDIPLADAIFAATRNPAQSIGIYDEVGSIAPGKKAHVLLVDDELNLKQVIM